MAGGIKISDFFAEIGFKINGNPLKELKTKAQDIAKQIQSSANAIAKTQAQSARDFKVFVDREQKVGQALKQQVKDKVQGEKEYNSHVAAYQKQRIKDERQQVKEQARQAAQQLKDKKKQEDNIRKELAETTKFARRQELEQLKQQNRIEQMQIRQSHRLEAAKARGGGGFGSAVSSAAGFGMRQLGPAIGAFGAFEFGKGIFDAAQLQAKTMAALTAVAGGPESAAKEYAFLNKEVDRLSLNLETASQGFVALKGSALGSEMAAKDVNDLFSATSEILTVYGASADDVQGTFRALGQMMSKTKITSEELKGQLSERVFGAVSMMAEANGMSVQALLDLMKEGDAVAAKMLPKLAEKFHEVANAGGALNKALDSPQAKLNRFQTQWQRFLIAVGESGALNLITKLFKILGDTLNVIKPHLGTIAQAFRTLWSVVQFGFDLVKDVFNVFSEFPAILAATVAGLVAFNPTVAAFAYQFVVIPAAILAAAAALQELIEIMKGGDSLFRDWSKEDGPLGFISRRFVELSEGLGIAVATAAGAVAAITSDDPELTGQIVKEDLMERVNRIKQAHYGPELRSGAMQLIDGVPVNVGSSMQLTPEAQLQHNIMQMAPRKSKWEQLQGLPYTGTSAPTQTVEVKVSADQQGLHAYVEQTTKTTVDNMLTTDKASMAGGR